jgi:beta-glucuronidase
MALRDINRPSVLFHGLSNESTGDDQRADALRELHEIDRLVDGTRLTGQAAYGSMPRDPTHEPLDVAGFTFYYGVFYGSDPRADTARALDEAHEANMEKPILALEFGRWVDDLEGTRQQRILESTYAVFRQRSAVDPEGYVGAAVWWTLEDFTTMAPRIALERFGLYRPDGSRRPAADAARMLFAASGGAGADQSMDSDAQRATVIGDARGIDLGLLGYLAYAIAVSLGSMSIALAVLVRRDRRRGRRAAGGLT